MSPKGVERARSEGYVPQPEFMAFLTMGLGRVAFMAKRWEDALKHYSRVVDDLGETSFTPEAIYWRAVCRYNAHGDHEPLVHVKDQLAKYPNSLWTAKAQVW